jgi:hypothetical protein
MLVMFRFLFEKVTLLDCFIPTLSFFICGSLVRSVAVRCHPSQSSQSAAGSNKKEALSGEFEVNRGTPGWIVKRFTCHVVNRYAWQLQTILTARHFWWINIDHDHGAASTRQGSVSRNCLTYRLEGVVDPWEAVALSRLGARRPVDTFVSQVKVMGRHVYEPM